MASQNVKNWEEPLPSSSTQSDCIGEEEEGSTPADERLKTERLEKLQQYVSKMAYRPVPPPNVKPYYYDLGKPKKVVLMSNYDEFRDVLDPRMRAQRLKRNMSRYRAISTEQLEHIIKSHKAKERQKEDKSKRKQEIYYEMLTKLERQCRSQYLNVLIKKFSNFIAKLATTMRIPPQLVEPYSRMQRGIFCNILLAVGVQPTNQAAIFYTSNEALEYEVCHKLAHALLSLIIKALDSAAARNPEDVKPLETDFEMDNYIKDRLMCAAEKKLIHTRQRSKARLSLSKPLLGIDHKCSDF